MKRIFFIRHAKSSWDNVRLRDFDRPLNARGNRDAPVMAKYLHAIVDHVDLLICSPANRTCATAKVFADEFVIETKRILHWKDLYEGSPSDYYEMFLGIDNEVNTVFVFGHNPAISIIASDCSSVYMDVATCGIVSCTYSGDWIDFDVSKMSYGNYFCPKNIEIN